MDITAIENCETYDTIENKCSKGFELQNAKTNKNTTLSNSEFEMMREFFNKIFKIDPSERLTLGEVK